MSTLLHNDKQSMENDSTYIKAITTYCDYILRTLERINYNKEIFGNDYLIKQALAFDLVQIGEYVKRISKETLQKYKSVNWNKTIEMYSYINNDFENVTTNEMWDYVLTSIKLLKDECFLINEDIKKATH